MPPEWKNYAPDPTPDPEEPPERQPGRQSARGRIVLYAILIGSLLAVSVVVLVIASVGGGDPQTEDGFADMLADLDEETGSATVFEAIIYPGYAVVRVPLGPGDEREIGYRWDGGLSEFTKGTSDQQPFDLSDVDGSLLGGFCEKARTLVEAPEDCYLIIRQPSAGAKKGWIDAHVSNEYSQGGYISYHLDGTEIARSTW